MNPYRFRTSGPAINRIAVAFVVLVAMGAIGASLLLGPKPNTTIVLMQPIRPAQTGTVALSPKAVTPSSDPVASLPEEQLPVIPSRPAKAVTTEPSTLEQSELGLETPAANASVTPMTDGSSAQTSSPTTSSVTEPVTKPVTSSQTPSAGTKTTTPSAPVEKPVPTVSSPIPPDTANSSVSATAAKLDPTTSSTTVPATPAKALLRRATNGVSVQVVALSSLDAAAKLAQNLAVNGFTANVQPSGKIFRVVIGPYPTEAAAQAAAARASTIIR